MTVQTYRLRVDDLGLPRGSHPENVAAVTFDQAGHKPKREHRVGSYRVDFAFPDVMIAVEVDGPHHLRPDVATKDVWRDNFLRDAGWLVLRVHYGDGFPEQLARISQLIHIAAGTSGPAYRGQA